MKNKNNIDTESVIQKMGIIQDQIRVMQRLLDDLPKELKDDFKRQLNDIFLFGETDVKLPSNILLHDNMVVTSKSEEENLRELEKEYPLKDGDTIFFKFSSDGEVWKNSRYNDSKYYRYSFDDKKYSDIIDIEKLGLNIPITKRKKNEK